MGNQLQKAEAGPTSGPTWRLSHLFIEVPVVEAGVEFLRALHLGVDVKVIHRRRLVHGEPLHVVQYAERCLNDFNVHVYLHRRLDARLGFGRIVVSEKEAPIMLANTV